MKQFLQKLFTWLNPHHYLNGAGKPEATYGMVIKYRSPKAILTILMLLCTQITFAQSKVSGKVTSPDGEVLPGVTILVKGTNNGTVSDVDGKYELAVNDPAEAVLVFSFVGFATQEVSVGNRSSIDLQMEYDVEQLNEVVVIGYGSQKKEDLTGAVVNITQEDFLVGRIQNASDLIKGKVAGLVISNGTGDPNGSASVMLRGVNSFEGGHTPLVLIDGVVGDMSTVNPESIESISVLKDASASAIYGTRGANGVILITTKGGMRDTQAKVTFNSYVSTSDFYKTADFMGPEQVRQGLTAFDPAGDWDTDWLKAITQRGFTQKHIVNVDGGTENTSYNINMSYRDVDGTIKGSDSEDIRLQLGIDQYFMEDKIKVGAKLWKEYHTNSANNSVEQNPNNLYRQAVIRNPTAPIYNEDGSYHENFNRFQYFNPVAMINELIGTDEIENTTMIGTLGIEPIKNWNTDLLLSQSTFNRNFARYTTKDYYASTTSGFVGAASQAYENSKQTTLELTSRYEFNINDHKISALVGYGHYDWINHGFNANNSNFSNDTFLYNQLQNGASFNEGTGAGLGSYKNSNRLIAFFGRVSYDFSNKYNLLASLRREGSSRFGENNKWGLFPGVSAGWTISNESFMNGVSWLNNLKLRAGVGVTGRQPDQNWQSLTLYNYDAAYGNYLNSNGEWLPGLAVEQNANPNLKWETTTEVNIGVDFSLLDDKVGGSIDVYNKQTKDLLFWYTVPSPPNATTRQLANAASFENKGIELMLTGTPVRTQDFTWTTTLTGSRNFNQILKFSNDVYETESYLNVAFASDPISVPTQRWEEGAPVANFWGLKAVGVTDDGIWIIEDPATGEAIPYSTSLNTDDYRQVLGNGMPKYNMGWNNTFVYKGFDLSIQMSGQFGFQILNQQRMFYENNSIQYNKLMSATDPVFGQRPLGTSQAQAFTSYYLEDGDYVKFDNVTLGYTLSVPSLQKYVSSIRFYASAQNFLILTKYSGLDPELANDQLDNNIGIDSRDKYPTIRSFTFGLNVSF